MERSTLNLVVVVIVALALLSLFLLWFAPHYLWQENPKEAIKKQLKKAETDLGHYQAQESAFPSEFVVHATGYETDSRNAVFVCNDDFLCCEQGKKCNKTIEWNNTGKQRYVSTKKKKKITLSTRCRYKNLYICKIYLGKKPAQIKINKLELTEKDINLQKTQSTKIKYKIKNTGKKNMIAVQPSAKLYKIKKMPYGREAEKIFFGEVVEHPFALRIGEEKTGELSIPIGENGDYQIEFTAVETIDKTNYETRTLELKARGLVELGKCEPGMVRKEWYSEIECKYYLPCEDCASLEECKRKWREKLGLSEGFDEFEIIETGEDITLAIEGEIIEGQECEKLCYEDWEVLKELEKSDKSLEVFIVLDGSGSMTEEIEELKNTIQQIVNSLREGCQTKKGEPCVKMGIYVIEGYDELSSTPIKELKQCRGERCPTEPGDDAGEIPLTNQLERIVTGLESITPTGNIEPWGDVIIYALESGGKLGWTENSYKGFIVMTDEEHNYGESGEFEERHSFEEIVNYLKERNIPAFTVWSELHGPQGEEQKQQLIKMGEETGGSSESYTEETEIPELLLKIITDLVRRTARAEKIKLCDEAICPEECTCEWFSHPGRPLEKEKKCSKEVCERCVKEKCLPLCVLPEEKEVEIVEEKPEIKCTATECQEDRENCKVWFLCECEGPENSDFEEKCGLVWKEKIGKEFELTVDEKDKTRAFIKGECKERTEEKCSDCELPRIEGCIKEEETSGCEPLSTECECGYPEPTEPQSITQAKITIKGPMVIIPTQPSGVAEKAAEYNLQAKPVLCHGLAYALARGGEENRSITVYRISGPNPVFDGHNAGPYVVVGREIKALEEYISKNYGAKFSGVNYYSREEPIEIGIDYVSQMRALQTCIADGKHDKPSKIFSKMKIPFKKIEEIEYMSKVNLDGCEALIVGCPGHLFGTDRFSKPKEFVREGGILIATDGINKLSNIALGAFPERLKIEKNGENAGTAKIFEGKKEGTFDLSTKLKKFFQVPFESSSWHLQADTTVFSEPLHPEVKALSYSSTVSISHSPAALMFGYGKGTVFHYKFHIEGSKKEAEKAGVVSSIYSGAFSEKLMLYPLECNTQAEQGKKTTLCPSKEGYSIIASNLFTETINNVQLKAMVEGREVDWIEFSENNFDLREKKFITITADIPKNLELGEHSVTIKAEAENAPPTKITGKLYIGETSEKTGKEKIICTKTFKCQYCISAEECIEEWGKKDQSIPEKVEIKTQNEFYYKIKTENEEERGGCTAS